MSNARKRDTAADRDSAVQSASDTTAKSADPKIRMVGSAQLVDSTDSSTRTPPKIRIVGHTDRLTPTECKLRFATNLDALLNIIGLSRKDAAVEIGISYPLIRRLATAGVSRIDDLNRESLSAVAIFFGLPTIDDLWRGNLLNWVMSPGDHCHFVRMFRERIVAEQKRRQALIGSEIRDELALINKALGVEATTSSRLSRDIEQKIAAILESPKGRHFGLLIDDYFQLVTGQQAPFDSKRA